MAKKIIILVLSLLLVVLPSSYAGKIFVNHDEWTISNTGFSSAPDTGLFVQNLTNWFTGGTSGNFLAYSTNFCLTESTLANFMVTHGHTWTVNTSISLDINTLLQYDAIFLGGSPVIPSNLLIQYVQAGGNIYLCGGTGIGGSSGEAANWNPFLNVFGLSFYGGSYNSLMGNLSFSSSHPVFQGVTALYSGNGSTILDLNPSDSAEVVMYNTTGLYGIYDGSAIPEPATVFLLVLGILFLKRKKNNF